MTFRLGPRSEERLKGVHEDLVRVVRRAIELTPVDFTVLEGVRTEERQRQLVAEGRSQTMKSRHLTGHAVDLGAYVGGKVVWDFSMYRQIAAAVTQAAVELNVPVEWGGNWKTFKDGPHFQLPWAIYPR